RAARAAAGGAAASVAGRERGRRSHRCDRHRRWAPPTAGWFSPGHAGGRRRLGRHHRPSRRGGRPVRIAIVGAGISGLVVARLLHGEHEITVFEAADYAGGHTNTVRVDTPNETHHVDTGFIVFNDRNYPRFERLLAKLGVPWQPSTMSFSVSDGRGDFEY